uniref:Uncharacterized protein n=1 Tax=Timema monikensis TaxID=170555 RepID=A0A7R9E681_9NEOP|nr:unnamed protein product [Timema monikensis]
MPQYQIALATESLPITYVSKFTSTSWFDPSLRTVNVVRLESYEWRLPFTTLPLISPAPTVFKDSFFTRTCDSVKTGRSVLKLNLEFDRYIPMSNGLRTQLYSAVDIDVDDSPEHFSDIAGLQEELIEVQRFGNQINLCRDRGLIPGPQAQKSVTLHLDRQVAPKVDESMSNTLNFLEKEVYTSKAVTPKKVTELVKEVQYSTSPTKLTKMELVAIMRSLTNWRKEFKPPFQQLTCLERKDEELNDGGTLADGEILEEVKNKNIQESSDEEESPDIQE